MLKSLTAAYEPSRRSDHWLKLKRRALAVCCVLDCDVCPAAWRSQSKTGAARPDSTALILLSTVLYCLALLPVTAGTTASDCTTPWIWSSSAPGTETAEKSGGWVGGWVQCGWLHAHKPLGNLCPLSSSQKMFCPVLLLQVALPLPAGLLGPGQRGTAERVPLHERFQRRLLQRGAREVSWCARGVCWGEEAAGPAPSTHTSTCYLLPATTVCYLLPHISFPSTLGMS